MAEAQPWSQKVRLQVALHLPFSSISLQTALALLGHCKIVDRPGGDPRYIVLWVVRQDPNVIHNLDCVQSFNLLYTPNCPQFIGELEEKLSEAYEHIATCHSNQWVLDRLTEKLSERI